MIIEDKQKLLDSIDVDVLSRTYQSFINYLVEGVRNNNVIDPNEYEVFRNQTIKNNLTILAHCYLVNLITFDEYMDKLIMIIGYDYIINGIINGEITDEQQQFTSN